MDFLKTLKSGKGLFLISLFILFILGLYFYGKFAGLFLIFSIMLFGIISLFWKEKELKIIALSLMVLLSLVNIGINEMKFGIDFSGGTRIPILLEQSVDETTMNELIDIIKKRSSVLGLSEVKVVAVGNSEIYVEVPSSDQEQILFIEEILAHQGVYQGIVDGKIAITGEDILPGTVQRVNPQYLSNGEDWGVSFTISSQSSLYFSQVIKGKANYPLYMFLDRPNDAIIFLSFENLLLNAPEGVSIDDLIPACEDALKSEKGDISLYIIDELLQNDTFLPKTNSSKAIVPENAPEWLLASLESSGFTIIYSLEEEISPVYTYFGEPTVIEWEAVGLLSAPRLSPKITSEDAVAGSFYSISGPAQGTGLEKSKNAEESAKRIISILKGGALPVQISLGSKTVLPPQLGLEFLRLSIIGIVLSLIVISTVVGLRYQSIKLILPIIIISICELIILISTLGSFTIDLAAMAGIIAAIGVGVDAQIVITDEILKKQIIDLEGKLQNAFLIIKTNAIVAIVGMLPLLFSGMVEVIGFAISTILGALLGFLVSRPAYAAIVENLVDLKNEDKSKAH
ncbi:MAG: hypothetical protein PHU63_02920 [Candidatus ainarchaeum sp.]|nr:hypothetical protein [Candidatus ainarchaeum sp.]